MSFSEVEIAQIRERFEEIDPGTVPKEIDPNSDAETPNSHFAFEYYSLKKSSTPDASGPPTVTNTLHAWRVPISKLRRDLNT